MKKRCLNPNTPRYKDYGGRGIEICNTWLIGFDCFAEWAFQNGYKKGLSIERKDVDSNYSPENCIWITRERQSFNKRTTRFVCYKGQTKCLMDWCNELGLCYDTIHARIEKGSSPEVAFEKPIADQSKSFARACRDHNINTGTAYDRIHKLGWTLERALNTPSNRITANAKTCSFQ